jgi:protein-disulfide isomerase
MTDLRDDDFPETSERREAARLKANEIRDRHRKQERRGRVLLRGGILVTVLVIVAVVALSILNTIRPPAPGPLNMLSDGIQIGANLVAKQTAALQPGDEPVPNVPADGVEVITIDFYVDYFAPDAAAFEVANNDQLETWVSSGAATLEVHPVAFRSSISQGYSTRAANAAGCVANYSPNTFFAFNSAVLAALPEDETVGGLTNDELLEQASATGASSLGSIEKCIADVKFSNWVTEASDRVKTEKIPNTDVTGITETPKVFVNGLEYTGAPADAQAFSAFVVQAAGQTFTEDSTATPEPTETPAPTESTTPEPTTTP